VGGKRSGGTKAQAPYKDSKGGNQPPRGSEGAGKTEAAPKWTGRKRTPNREKGSRGPSAVSGLLKGARDPLSYKKKLGWGGEEQSESQAKIEETRLADVWGRSGVLVGV